MKEPNVSLSGAEFDAMRKAMSEFTTPLVTPISHGTPNAVPELTGTGNFVSLVGMKALLTCCHVIFGKQNMAVLPPSKADLTEFKRAPGAFLTAPDYPYDLAIGQFADDQWAALGTEARAVSLDRFDLAHVAVDGECLFFRGYAFENSAFAFDVLKADSSSYTTQEVRGELSGRDFRYFFFLSHNVEKTTNSNRHVRFENPEGFSGSLVWNTNFVRCQQEGVPWSTEHARVTGIACRWVTDEPGLRVLRVEHLRAFLLDIAEAAMS